jgi:hypothetical protein
LPVLEFRQVEESADDLHMQQRFMVVASSAQGLSFMQTETHRGDSGPNMFMTADALRERAWLTNWLKLELGTNRSFLSMSDRRSACAAPVNAPVRHRPRNSAFMFVSA